MPESHETSPTNEGRRQLLRSGVAATGAGLLAASAGPSSAKDIVPPKTTPFVMRLPVYRPKRPVDELNPPAGPGAAERECGRNDHEHWEEWHPTKFYELEVRENNHIFHEELPQQKIWGYDGITPGPTFVARYGEPIIVRIENKLSDDIEGYGSPEISTHLHNAHSASASDGFTGNYFSSKKFGPTLTRSGDYQDHHYANCYAGYDKFPLTNGDPREALGTLWYHDHRLDFTAPNVYRGLAGFYLLFDHIDSGNENDTNPAALRLPSGVGVYDIPLMIQDKLFNSSGYLKFNQFETDGFLGNKYLVNGVVQPYFSVERRKYRFRLLNASTSRFYELFLVAGGVDKSFSYIANDGNLLPETLIRKSVRLGNAERADIVVDFSEYPIGSKLFLVNRLAQTDGRGPSLIPLNPGISIMRFDVDREPSVKDNSRVPLKLRPLPPIDLNTVVRRRTFEFDRENDFWTVNGKVFDVFTPRAVVKRGTAEIWTLKGKGSWWHPVHIHFEEGRILTRNGKPPPPHEVGRKDVFVLAPGEEVRVYIQFRDFTGKYMMHCHNTTHEDHAMMMRFDIVP